MSQDSVIVAEGVSKKFSRNLKRSMVYGVSDIARSLVGLSTKSDRLRSSEFWAVRDVGFEVARGETLGIIGRNGSGKSTLLKMLNGIYFPDKGRIQVKGRVGALIEVGSGFHPMLSGRENIYVNGTILGMGREEIRRKFDSIADFAEVGDFLDMPVKHYSSGMYVRLGFAVAAHCEPDVLLVDEILSVGDFAFQSRCVMWMRKFQENGGTVVFVSHNLMSVMSLCDRAMLLDAGEMKVIGKADRVIDQYMQLPTRQVSELTAFGHGHSDDLLQVSSCRLVGKDGEIDRTLHYGERFDLHFEVESLKPLKQCCFAMSVLKDANPVFELSMVNDGLDISLEPGRWKVICELGEILLTPGQYIINAYVQPKPYTEFKRRWYLWPRPVGSFTVLPEAFLEVEKVDPVLGRVGRMIGTWVKHSWKVSKLSEGAPLVSLSS